jgi:hypothetical protein
LSGHFVLQAKHIKFADRSCSDKNFDRLLKKEHPKIRRLRSSGICDHYLVFTNRRLSGGADEKLIPAIIKLGPKTAHILGTDHLHIALDMYQDVRATLPNLNDQMPFRFEAEDLREVIGALHDYTARDTASAFDSALDFETVGLVEKNRINGLTPAYYKEIIVAA